MSAPKPQEVSHALTLDRGAHAAVLEMMATTEDRQAAAARRLGLDAVAADHVRWAAEKRAAAKGCRESGGSRGGK